MERILGRGLLCFALVLASSQQAEAKKFLISFKTQNNLHPLLRAFAKQRSLTALTEKVNSQSRVKATALTYINVMIAEGTKEEVEQAVAGDDSVELIEEDKPIKLTEAQTDNFGAQPANSPYLRDVLGLTAANPSYTVTKPSGNTPILVAVIDTGMNINHPFLVPFRSVNDGEDLNHDGIIQDSEINGIDDDGNGYIDDFYGANVAGTNGSNGTDGDVEDVYDHGTHVAGLIKTVRDQAIAMGFSAAQNIQVLPIRFFYDCGGGLCGSTSGAVLALNYALSRKAKVVNMSWGSEGADSYSQILFDALVKLYNHDVTLVAAAGNESANADTTPFFPAAHSPSIPGLISVNSITSWHNSDSSLDEITLSSFSNFGTNSVDVAAPGSTYFLYGGMLSSNGYYNPPYNSTRFVPKSGTSMASPIVAGIAGVVRALKPSLNAYDVKQLIVSNAVVPKNGSVKILANRNRAEGYVNAVDSFDAALGASGSGIMPAATNSTYSSGSSNKESSGGGCGAIINPGAGGGNPFGGNSMGLLTALFFMSKLVVQFRRRMLIKKVGV